MLSKSKLNNDRGLAKSRQSLPLKVVIGSFFGVTAYWARLLAMVGTN